MVSKANTLPAAGLGKEKPFFLVPFVQDSQFVGREDIISNINEKFKTEQRVALTGIGGVGYTVQHLHKDRIWLITFVSTVNRK